MRVEQKFDTPGDALAHYGKKGMRWGYRNTLDSVGSTPKRDTQEAPGAAAAFKTSGGVSGNTQKLKAQATRIANKKAQLVKANAKARADAKADKVTAKAQKVAANPTAKKAGRELQGVAWGTRQAYIEKTLKDAERAGNIGKGTAAIDSKLIATKDLVFTKRQARFAEKVFAQHAKRVKEGELKTRDLLLMSARLRRRDLTIGMDIAGKRNDRAKKRGQQANFDIPLRSLQRG